MVDIKLPSSHQTGDKVKLDFMAAGSIPEGEVCAVKFDGERGKVWYDVRVMLDETHYTILKDLDSVIVVKQ